MIEQLLQVLSVRFAIYLALILLTVVVGIINYKRYTTAFRLLFVLCVVSFISEIAGRVLIPVFQSSTAIYHFYTPIAYVLLSLCYRKILPDRKAHRYFVQCTVPLVILFSVPNAIWLQSLRTLPTNSLLVVSVLILTQVMMMFHYMLIKPLKIPLMKQGMFWFNAANLLFYGIMFFFASYHNFFVRTGNYPNAPIMLVYFSNILLYLFYSVALILAAKDNV